MPKARARITSAPTETQQLAWASPEQKEIFEYGPAPICASGGFGAAKTWGLCMKAIMLSDMFPGNRGVIIRKVYTELQRTTMSTFYKILPSSSYNFGGARRDNEKYLRLNNGSEILFMHLDDPDVANVIKGLEINWFLIDQAEEVYEEIFDKLLTRLGRWDGAVVPEHLISREQSAGRRWHWLNTEGKPVPPVYAMIACNPDTKLHWIYRRFHPESKEHSEPRERPDGTFTSYQAEGYRMVTMSSLSNRFLGSQNKTNLLAQDVSFQHRFVHGTWGIPEGQIHNIPAASLIPGTHEFVQHLLRSCTLHRSLDHGDTAPTCCAWWAVDQLGNIFLYREYYQPDRLISYHRREITSLSKGEQYTLNLADPQIFAKTAQKYGGRWSVADDYLDSALVPGESSENCLFWEPADNNELVTRSRINEYLAIDPLRLHPVTRKAGSPRLFFITRTQEWPNGCFWTVKHAEAQMRVKVGTEMGKPIYSDERDTTITDHAYDVIRYFVASRPPVASITAPRTMHNTFNTVRAQAHAFEKQIRLGMFDGRRFLRRGRTRVRGY